jgi:4-hydroxybenzoate polyprenyltransferase
VTSWALFVFCISWNFARDISTVFEEIKHLRSRAPDNILPDYYNK